MGYLLFPSTFGLIKGALLEGACKPQDMQVCVQDSWSGSRETCFDGAMVWQAEETAAWKVRRAEEGRRLERERALLAKQTRALVKLPTKKERAEVSQQVVFPWLCLEADSSSRLQAHALLEPACALLDPPQFKLGFWI